MAGCRSVLIHDLPGGFLWLSPPTALPIVPARFLSGFRWCSYSSLLGCLWTLWVGRSRSRLPLVGFGFVCETFWGLCLPFACSRCRRCFGTPPYSPTASITFPFSHSLSSLAVLLCFGLTRPLPRWLASSVA